MVMDGAWTWPPELDGVVAAPDHHRVLLENDEVRVIETRIGAGESVPVHCHSRPTVTYVVSVSHFVSRDEDGEVTNDTRLTSALPAPSQVYWSESIPAHSLENVGEDDIVLIGVELKNPTASHRPASPRLSTQG